MLNSKLKANLLGINFQITKMKKRYFNSILPKIGIITIWLVAFCSGCSEDFFNKQPLDAVSNGTFWKTEADAQLGLVGCYFVDNGWGWGGHDFWHFQSWLYLDMAAGNGSEGGQKMPDNVTDGTLSSSNGYTYDHWKWAYAKIAACNNFLDHSGTIIMDKSKMAMMIAEVKTLRAYEYFYLTLFFGDVPLADHVLTMSEANSISRTTRADILAFVEKDLNDSYTDLPITRPDNENGRITKGAALAILGRVQMYEKKWTAAAETYKKIIDDHAYIIQNNFRELFWEQNELSKEIILSMQYTKGLWNQHATFQFLYPYANGGWHDFNPYNELVKEFECTDGKTIDVSPLYDSNNPYDNRDPRLYYTINISGRNTFQGQPFISTPNSGTGDALNAHIDQFTGYGIFKFLDENFHGNLMASSCNFILIRYPEVLLSYLESKLESGAPIDQSLLDQTINMVRGRATVNMPKVTTTNVVDLRKIVRRERRVELAFEGLRYYDILRWGIAAEELDRQFTGMKLTNDPANYKDYPVDADGYYITRPRHFIKGKNELWPIPQAERDLNKNLTQNPGY